VKRSDGITALMAAAVGGHFKVSCIYSFVDVFIGDLTNSHAQAVKLLVDKGADLSEKDKEGLTALINAAEASNQYWLDHSNSNEAFWIQRVSLRKKRLH